MLPGHWATGHTFPITTPIEESSLPGELQGNLGKNQKLLRHPGSGRGSGALKILRAGRMGEKEPAWDQTQTGHQLPQPSELGTS